MSGVEELQRRFLEQLRALEQFRIAFTGQNPGVPLHRADQDVQRLLEAQAFFSARTISAAERAMTKGTRRLFAQHLPYLLQPVPATAMIGAQLDAQFVDPVQLGAGEELGVDDTTPELEDTPPPVVFRTLTAMPIWPLQLTDQRFERPRPKAEAEVWLRFDAAHRRRWPVSPLVLYVDHLGELESSAALHLALRDGLLSAEVRWDGGEPFACPVRFDPPAIGAGVGLDHPLDQVRTFFRLPEMDLFVTLLPPSPPGEWSRFEVRLRLSDAWPRGLGLEPGALRMHVVPTVNLRRELASPITIDGTQSLHPIDHPDALAGYVLRGIRGTYRVDAREGMVPLVPGFVPDTGVATEKRSDVGQRWEVDCRGAGGKRRGILRMTAAEALVDPFRVSVDGLWHQPDRAAALPDGAAAELIHRSLNGVGFSLVGRARAAVNDELADDDEALLSLLGARSRRTLTLSDLRTLIDVLRGPQERVFEPLVRGLVNAEVRSVPSARASGGFRYRYRLQLDGVGPGDVPKLVLLGHRLRQMLGAWSTEDVVEVAVDLPHLDRRFEFRDDGGRER